MRRRRRDCEILRILRPRRLHLALAEHGGIRVDGSPHPALPVAIAVIFTALAPHHCLRPALALRTGACARRCLCHSLLLYLRSAWRFLFFLRTLASCGMKPRQTTAIYQYRRSSSIITQKRCAAAHRQSITLAAHRIRRAHNGGCTSK